jgi:hypothetical protein
MGIFSAVDCVEEHVTRNEDYDVEGGFSASVTVRCAWLDRFTLMADVIGRQWPDSAAAWCNSIGCVPDKTNYTVSGQEIVYSDALVTLKYGTKVKDLFSDSLEPTAEFITADHKQFRWTAATGVPLLEAEAPGYLMRSCNLVRTLYQRPSIPADILDLVGTSNSAAYTSSTLGLTFGIEKLMFQPPTLNRAYKTNGTEGWTITVKFAYKPQTWNKFWRAAAGGGVGGWDTIYHVSGGQYKPHPPSSFANYLF